MLAWICASLCCHEQTYGLVFGGKRAGWAAQVWLPCGKSARVETGEPVSGQTVQSLCLEGHIAFPALFL